MKAQRVSCVLLPVPSFTCKAVTHKPASPTRPFPTSPPTDLPIWCLMDAIRKKPLCTLLNFSLLHLPAPSPHLQSVSRTCWYCLLPEGIPDVPTSVSAVRPICAPITSHPDISSGLSPFPTSSLDPLQSMLHTIARGTFIKHTRQSHHITAFEQLSMALRIKSKVPSLVYKSNTSGPRLLTVPSPTTLITGAFFLFFRSASLTAVTLSIVPGFLSPFPFSALA